MRLNEDKCKILHIPGQQASPVPIATINGKQLELVNSYKYLGIIINSELDWTEEWEKIQKSTEYLRLQGEYSSNDLPKLLSLPY